MFGYRCDKCGMPVNVDPGEERICDSCQAVRDGTGQQVKITYPPKKREVSCVS